jgi:hypothetical protein
MECLMGRDLIEYDYISVNWDGFIPRRAEEYRSPKNDIGDVVEDFDDVGKLGNGFVSTDELMEVDIEDEGVK